MVECFKANLANGERTGDLNLINLKLIRTKLIFLIKGLKTATSFWPGSETYPYTADIYLQFMPTADITVRSIQIAEWVKKLEIDFAALYLDRKLS